MKRLMITMILLGTLSVTSLAGQIPSDGSPSPDPNPTPTAESAPGDMPISGKSEFSSEALSALLSVLSFLT